MTALATAGRIAREDLRAPLSAASAAKASEIVLAPDCSLSFATEHVSARIPFAGRGWDGVECRLNRRVFARIVRACRSDLLLERGKKDLVVSSGALTVALPLLPAAVPVEHREAKELLTVNARMLARMLLRAEPFTSSDETRPVLNAVALDHDCGKVVGCDSYRLVVIDAPELKHDDAGTLLWPVAAVRPIAQALAAHSGDVTLRSFLDGETKLVVEIGDARWVIKLFSGRYPEWPHLLSDREGTTVQIDATELASVASLIADANAISRARSAPMVLHFKPGHVLVTNRLEHLRGAVVSQQIAAEGKVDEPIEIGMNPQFVYDVMSAIAPDRPLLTWTEPLRPLLAQTPDATFLLMPLRLNI
jgi:DNA polymerase III sliding clamp (beta) subunit (PCNA family)